QRRRPLGPAPAPPPPLVREDRRGLVGGGRAAPAGGLPRAEPRGPLADEGPLRRDLLPQRRDLLRRRNPGEDLGALRAGAEPRRGALHRPLRTRHRPGRRPTGDLWPDRLPVEGRRMTVRVLVVDDSATMRSL